MKYKSAQDMQDIMKRCMSICSYCGKDNTRDFHVLDVPIRYFPSDLQNKYPSLRAITGRFHDNCFEEIVSNVFNLVEEENEAMIPLRCGASYRKSGTNMRCTGDVRHPANHKDIDGTWFDAEV